MWSMIFVSNRSQHSSHQAYICEAVDGQLQQGVIHEAGVMDIPKNEPAPPDQDLIRFKYDLPTPGTLLSCLLACVLLAERAHRTLKNATLTTDFANRKVRDSSSAGCMAVRLLPACRKARWTFVCKWIRYNSVGLFCNTSVLVWYKRNHRLRCGDS